MPSGVRRLAPLLAYAVLLIALAAPHGSPRTVGDAGEYLAYVSRFARGQGPAIPPDELPGLQRDLIAVDPALASWDIEAATFADRHGARHFVHFWLYPAIATPFVWVARSAGLDLRAGFLLMHVVMLLIAFHAVARAAGWIVALLLMAGPIVWWLDKPHPEVFLFTLMSAAFSSWRDRPVVALICAGLAGAQVAPLAIFVPLLAVVIGFEGRAGARGAGRAGLATGATIAVAIAAGPPLYYLWRFGEVSLFGRLSSPHWPWPHFGTELIDLTVGLLPNWPMLAAALAFAGSMALPRALRRRDVVAALAGAIALLIVFPQIGNITHGGTPGVSRYGLWLAPLAIPLFAAVHGSRTWLWLSLVLTAASVPYSLIHFHPTRGEFSHRPTAVALWVWRHHPGWSTPMPRVFVNALRAPDETAPVATAHCTKTLLIGRGESQGMWPRACVPAQVPAECRSPGTLCYANRDGLGYRFTAVTSWQANFRYDPQRVWPKAAEAGVLSAMVAAGWAELAPIDPSDPASMIAGVEGGAIDVLLQDGRRLFAVIRATQPGARVTVGHAAALRGVLTNGQTGQAIRDVALDGAGESTIALDEDGVVLLALRRL